jgi:hypothetical protein
MMGGQINWAHMEALVSIVQMNLMELSVQWMDIHPPMGLEATRPYSVPGAANHASEDCACVEGIWK